MASHYHDIDPTTILVARETRQRQDGLPIDDLIPSIRARGILLPLLVTGDAATGVHLIAGERRLKTAIHLRLTTVPVRFISADADAVELQMIEFEESRYLAANIRGARIVALGSNNHIVLADEPAWPVFLRELTEFLSHDRPPDAAEAAGAVADDVAAVLSPRELDILALAAQGHDNDAIAAELVLSVRTVERHLQNAYAKLGLQGRNARTAAVARLLSRA